MTLREVEDALDRFENCLCNSDVSDEFIEKFYAFADKAMDLILDGNMRVSCRNFARFVRPSGN